MDNLLKIGILCKILTRLGGAVCIPEIETMADIWFLHRANIQGHRTL